MPRIELESGLEAVCVVQRTQLPGDPIDRFPYLGDPPDSVLLVLHVAYEFLHSSIEVAFSRIECRFVGGREETKPATSQAQPPARNVLLFRILLLDVGEQGVQFLDFRRLAV